MRGLALVAVLCGCGRLAFDTHDPSGDAPTMGQAAASDGAMSGGGDSSVVGGDASGSGAPGTGTGTISGTAPDGKPFTQLVGGYIIGHPKFIGETSIYMFSGPIKCSDIGYPGWGQWITSGTQCMELQLPTTATGTYPGQSNDPPPAASGFGRYRYGEGSGGEITSDGTGGQVVVTSVGADGSISGTFNITFQLHGPLVGTFTAVSCPTGYYPTFP